MNCRKILTLLLTVLLTISLFAGCSSYNGTDKEAGSGGSSSSLSDSVVKEDASLVAPEQNENAATSENLKIITTLYIDAETEALDPLLAEINAKVVELGGYMQEQNIYNGSAYSSGRSRYANLIIRIPAESLDMVVNQVSETSNIISQKKTTENITLSYVATQSRITALQTEQTRLLELLAMAENMEDLLMIESRLTEVRSELEEVTSQLRLYDNLVDYGTIHLNIQEVREFTQVEEPDTVWERIASGFMESLKNLGKGLTELFVFLVTSLPYLVLMGGIVVVVILIVKRKKKKKVPAASPEEKNP